MPTNALFPLINPALGAALFLVLRDPRPRAKMWLAVHAVLTAACVGALYFLAPGTRYHAWVVGGVSIVTGTVPAMILAFARLRGFFGAKRSSLPFEEGWPVPVLILASFILVTYAALTGFGRTTMAFWAYPLFVAWIVGMIFALYLTRMKSSEAFSDGITSLSGRCLRSLGEGELPVNEAFREVCSGIAQLLHAKRVSITEVVGGKFRFLGCYGAYDVRTEFLEVRSGSYLGDAIISGQEGKGTAPSLSVELKDNEFRIFLLRHCGEVRGAVCITDFERGGLPPHLIPQLERLRQNCEGIFNLLRARRDQISQLGLGAIVRPRLTLLQQRAEEYFLANFDLSERVREYAFICGEIANAPELSADHGMEPVIGVLDVFLEALWQRFWHLGMLPARAENGRVMIIFPRQANDGSSIECASRCTQVLAYLNRASQVVGEIALQRQLRPQFDCRFVASLVQEVGIASDSRNRRRGAYALADAALDGAEIALAQLSGPNECLIAHDVYRIMLGERELETVPRERFDGSLMRGELFILKKSVSGRQAA